MPEVIIACVMCGDLPGRHHKHLHVNEEKGKFFCQLCKKGGTTEWLFQRYPDVKDMLMLGTIANARRSRRANRIGKLERLVQKDMSITRKVVSYVLKRGLTEQELFDVWWQKEMPGRAVFVCREAGEVVFWTARSMTDARPKWRFPAKGETKVSRGAALFGMQWQEKTPNKEIWIVEGVFDAYAVNGIAILGSYCSDSQLKKILSLIPRKVIIALDRDAKDNAEKLAEKISPILPVEIVYAPEEYEDWGEMLEKGVL